jgi:DNA polymerase-3 subunit beta
MVGMARSNFPSLPAFPEKDVYHLPAKALHTMISKTIFAISNEESRYTLNGAQLVLKAESMTMVATDGHRLAHIENAKAKPGVSGELRILVPKKAMAELNSLLNDFDGDSIEFARDESTLFFRLGARLLTSRQLTGQFPNYEAVLPRDNNKSVVLATEELAGAIQRVAQFADERSGAIKLRLDKGEIKVSSSSSDAGESEDSLPTTYEGDAITIGFNSAYLVDFLKNAGSPEVRLEFKDAQSAGQMRPEEPSDSEFKYRYIVMPMRI